MRDATPSCPTVPRRQAAELQENILGGVSDPPGKPGGFMEFMSRFVFWETRLAPACRTGLERDGEPPPASRPSAGSSALQHRAAALERERHARDFGRQATGDEALEV